MRPSPQTDPVLAQLEWVRGLCLRLVRDVASADDLVQEVWIVAQENLPPHVRGDGPVRGWLAGVARNLVRNLGRSDSHRRTRERDHGSRARLMEHEPPSDDLIARSEVLKLVAEGVLALDEPFRRTMLLRWFEGHTAREIAAMESVQEGTVHSRLHRGSERLRAWMTRHHPGAEHDWALALIPVASRALVLEGGRRWLTIQAAAAAAALSTVGAGTLLWITGKAAPQDRVPEAVSTEFTASEPLEPVAAKLAQPDIALDTDRDALATDSTAVASPPPDELTVQVWTHAGAPARRVTLRHLREDEDGQLTLTDIYLQTDETGRASASWPELERREALSGAFEARIVALDYPVAPYGPGASEVTLVLPPTATVIAEVEDASGAPVEFEGDLHLLVPQTERPSRNWVSAPVEEAQAVFDHVAIGMGRLNLQPRIDWLEESFFEGPARAGEVLRTRCVAKRDWTVFMGRAVDPAGGPVPGVDLALLAEGGASASARADGAGTFTFALPRRSVEDPYRCTYRVRTPGPFQDALGALVIDASTGEARVDIGELTVTPLPPWLAGRVVDGAGQPVEGATVSVTARAPGGHGVLGSLSRTTLEDGAFELPEFVIGLLDTRVTSEDVETVELELTVRRQGFVRWESALQRTRDLDLRIKLERATFVSARVTAAALPASNFSLVARRRSAQADQPRFFGQALGKEALSCELGPGTWTVSVHSGGYLGLPLFQWEPLTLEPGTKAAALPEVSLDAHVRSKTLRFESESGETIERVDLQLENLSTSARGNELTQDGTIRLFLPDAPVRICARGRAQQRSSASEATWVSTGDGDETITLRPR